MFCMSTIFSLCRIEVHLCSFLDRGSNDAVFGVEYSELFWVL